MAITRQALRIFSVALFSGLLGAPALAEVKIPVPAFDQSAVAKRGFFYVGGHYVGDPGKQIMQGQMYVEVLVPKRQRRPYPLVLIHGAAQTATNWMGTPDGRKGWAEYFVEQGYVVYMVDQPMRARSAYHPADGATRMFTAENEEFQFTAIETNGTWPGREKHTQWPGEGPNKGKAGDPVFDAFYATQVETVISPEETEQRNQDAGAALLDKIGPAIVLTHSQSGAFGWLIADARPKLVKAIIAIEPAGPPFEGTIIATGKARPWGPTDIPITYDPPVKDPSEIAVVREEKPDGPNMFTCWMQKAPARQLINLKNIPTVVISAEASYHQLYDNCTVKYLNQAGMTAEWMPLQSKGIHGNGHMVMIEKNNLAIAKVIDDWAVKNVKWRSRTRRENAELFQCRAIAACSFRQRFVGVAIFAEGPASNFYRLSVFWIIGAQLKTALRLLNDMKFIAFAELEARQESFRQNEDRRVVNFLDLKDIALRIGPFATACS